MTRTQQVADLRDFCDADTLAWLNGADDDVYSAILALSREQLSDELASACEYTEDWHTAPLAELQARYAALLAN